MHGTDDERIRFANCFMNIDCQSIGNNLKVLRRKTKSRIMAVLKNNGYGLSLIEYAQLLVDLGVTDLAVGSYEEAIALRINGIGASILLLTPQTSVTAVENLILQQIMLTVGSMQQSETVRRAAAEMNRQPRIHIKIDTGLGRYGFLPDELQQAIALVKDMNVEGTYTHFSSPYSSRRKTHRQFEAFLRSVQQLKCNGVNPGTLHCCASGGLLNFPDMHLDMVRAGSALLGRVPRAGAHGLVSAVSLMTQITAVKLPPNRSRMGYHGSMRLPRNARIGILSVGSACGLQPARRMAGLLKSKQYAVINGRRARILGSLGIGSLAVDLSGIGCREGDLAELNINPLYCAADIQRVFDNGSHATASACNQFSTITAKNTSASDPLFSTA